VGYLDAVARAGHLDPEAELAWTRSIHDNDVRAVRTALRLVDPRSESVKESELRVVLHTAGIEVTPQHVVLDEAGRFVARVDPAIPRLRIAIEYDGAWHASREQLEKDRARLNRLREAGWTVVSVTAAMLRDPEQVVAAVRREIVRRTVTA
jgi:very-short-patch-repair endonuclease